MQRDEIEANEMENNIPHNRYDSGSRNALEGRSISIFKMPRGRHPECIRGDQTTRASHIERERERERERNG